MFILIHNHRPNLCGQKMQRPVKTLQSPVSRGVMYQDHNPLSGRLLGVCSVVTVKPAVDDERGDIPGEEQAH